MVNRWGNNGNSDRLIFLGSKITVDGDCTYKIKRCLLLEEKLQQASVQFSSVTQSCPTLCDPMNCSTPGLPVHHQLPEFTQTHVHWVGDTKSVDITLLTKVRLVKAMVFPVVMYGCESWTIKKAECRRIDAFELWCWRSVLRVPWTARSSNQSILKEINLEYPLEELMLKLKLQYFCHQMERADSLEKTLILGKIEGKW